MLFINEFTEVNGEWELVSIVDLGVSQKMVDEWVTHFDQSIFFNIVLESSKLKVKNRGECVENDTLLRCLKSITFCVVFVLPIQSLH